MESSIFKQAADFLRNKKNAKRWLAVFLCLAVVAGIGTYAGLKMNGRAMTKQSRELACAYEVHKHTESCYGDVDGERKLVCGYADYVVHTHNDDCYDESGSLVCPLPEIKEHKHDDSCYSTVRTLTCGQTEAAEHTHTDDCYSVSSTLTCGQEETPGHTHDETCYDAEGNLICGQEETPGHTHDASCYTEERTLVCGQEETPGHTHSDACYSEERALTCGELELHTHTDACYEVQEGVDADNDGEDDKVLICEIPVLEEHMHTADCFKVVEAGEETPADSGDAADGETSGDSAPADSGEERELYTMTTDEPEVAAEHTKTYEDDGIRVTAEYGDEAGIPDDAELRVKKVTASDDLAHYEQRKEEALSALGTNTAGNVSIYNIGFFLDKKEIEPAAPVKITIQVLKDGFETGDPINVVHFGEKGAEVIGDTKVDEDGNASFTSDEFSDFVLMDNSEGNDGSTVGGNNGTPQNDQNGDTSGDGDNSDMSDLLGKVTIETESGESITDGKLFVGEKYKITLTFAEGGAQSAKQFKWTADGTMTFQLPANFKVDPKSNIPLTIEVNGKPVTIGQYSVTEDGKLVVTLDETGEIKLKEMFDAALSFEMDATVQAGDGSDGGHIKFDDAGEDFNFEVVDQARVEVDKQGKYTENAEKTGGQLEYTVTTTVKRGSVSDLSILDEFTPPNTTALKIEDVNPKDIKVTLKQRGVDGTVTDVVLTKDTDYELVEVDDAEHPGKKTFQVKLKEGSTHSTLNEGDVLEVTYPYEVEYVKGSADVFWGNVANDVHVTGSGKVPAPADNPEKEMPEIDIDEHRGSNVEIQVVPPGDGIIFKTQEFSEADHKLHYTLYTTVPAGEWKPFYIHDDMVVEFGGEKYNLTEFKKDGRVSNLTVSAVDVEGDDNLGNWSDSTDEQRQQSLEDLKERAHKLTGYDIYNYWSDAPEGYDPESVENYICLWERNNLDIVFGEWTYGDTGPWGNWDYDKDRLIITEYDLDMSNDKGPVTLLNTSDYTTEIEKEASDVLLAGIRNTVYMRFDGYYPGYSVFFNNADRMNKTGAPDKSDNTITWTVTMNTTDTTVNQYFQDVKTDWMALNADDKYHWGDFPKAYDESMQTVFYDELPDGWEYVEGSLTATARDKWGNQFSYPYDKNGQLKGSHDLVTSDGGKQVIRAPLMFFYDADLKIGNLFDWFNGNLVSLTFTYKLKATDQWIRDHATDKTSVDVPNTAEIRDKLHEQAHWTAETKVPYIPQHLSKTAQQVGDSNLLQFTLHVNPGNVKLDSEKGYLVVTDTSTNLEIQTNSIKVTDAAEHELTQMTYEEGMTLGDDQWTLMPETESGQFKLMVPDGKALLVTYNALIPQLGTGISVSNKAGIEGIVNADSGFNEIINVNSINAGGSGSTYALNFEKVDSTNDVKKLPGAKFKFYIVVDRDGEDQLKETDKIKVGDTRYSCYSEDGWEFTTDANGVYEIPSSWRLAQGYYYILVETDAPAGYEKLTEPVLFYFGDESKADKGSHPGATSVLPGCTLTVDDPPVPYDLPETGGPGTIIYTMGGLLLIVAFGALMYSKRIRERRGGSSRI